MLNEHTQFLVSKALWWFQISTLDHSLPSGGSQRGAGGGTGQGREGASHTVSSRKAQLTLQTSPVGSSDIYSRIPHRCKGKFLVRQMQEAEGGTEAPDVKLYR